MRCGAMWCGVAWRGVAWRGVAWCDVVMFGKLLFRKSEISWEQYVSAHASSSLSRAVKKQLPAYNFTLSPPPFSIVNCSFLIHPIRQ